MWSGSTVTTIRSSECRSLGLRPDRVLQDRGRASGGLRRGTTTAPRPVTDNRNLLVLVRSHIDLVMMDDPVLPRPDWILTRPRLTGTCGSESKAVFAD